MDSNSRHEDGHINAEEEEGVVSIKEYVEELEAQELEMDMILGGDNGKDCTYPKGYLPRQAIFSCITCCPDGNAGVCTACSVKCHDGHEVIEIWTRRHFRCDCGNSKFGIKACKLFSSKDLENNENVYNKNYKGVYCTCNRPYPDPDAVEDMGEMLQCCVCEDWFHEAHLGLASTEDVPRDEEGEPSFEEVICQACADSLDFLSYYESLMVPIKSSTSPCEEEMLAAPAQSNGNVDERVEVFEANAVELDPCQLTEEVSPTETNDVHIQQSDSSKQRSCDQNIINGGAISSNGSNRNKAGCSRLCQPCKLLSLEATGLIQNDAKVSITNCSKDQNWTSKALFLSDNWRLRLCRCDACMELYAKKHVSFLMDANDSIAKYEEVAKEKRKEKMDGSSSQNLSFLNGISHVAKIEFMHGLNEMTSELSAFLNSCESTEAITSADIYEFFENLKKKKRGRLE